MILSNVMDRRLGQRIPADLLLTTYRHGIGHSCRALDLSSGGALLQRRDRRRAPFFQRMELPVGSANLEMHARTVWTRGYLQAVSFVGLSDVDRLDIAEYLDDLVRQRLKR